MAPSRYLRPTSLSPAASLHLWITVLAVSLGPAVALVMPIANEFRNDEGLVFVLGVPSAVAANLLVLIALAAKSPRRAAISALWALPFSVVVCALGGGAVRGTDGFIFGGIFGLGVATPVGLLFALLLAPLFKLAKRAHDSGALLLRDKVNTLASSYAGMGCIAAILLGQPRWFLVPAIVSFGFTLERILFQASRARFLSRAERGDVAGLAVAPVEALPEAPDVPALHDATPTRVLLEISETQAYRESAAPRALLGV